MSVHTLTEKQQRRRTNERANKRGRRKLRVVKAVWPSRDLDYKRWIATLPCMICRIDFIRSAELFCRVARQFGIPVISPQLTSTEAAHSGPHGIGQKASDRTCLPLCRGHHREYQDSYHVLGVKFFEHHELDRDKIVTTLNKLYAETA
jgi:hypothetical protein